MANPLETLYILIKVHIGILGFSALISVLSQRSWNRSEVRLRFWTILVLGLTGIILSWGPALLSNLFLKGNSVWIVGCIAGLMGWILITGIFTALYAKVYRSNERVLIPNWINFIYQVPFTLSLIIFSIGCFKKDNAANYFITGMFFFTVAAVGNFICFLVAHSNAKAQTEN